MNPEFAVISAAAAGANSVVAAESGKRIIVMGFAIVAAGAVTVKFFSDGTADTDLTGAMSLAANGGVAVYSNPEAPLFESLIGEGLGINLGGAVQVSGFLTYSNRSY